MSTATSARAQRSNVTREQTSTSTDARTKKTEFIPSSVTTAKGFINAITEIDRVPGDESKTLFFARLAIVTGREQYGDDYRDRMQFVEVLVGGKLRKLAANAVHVARLDDEKTNCASNDTAGFIFKDVLCHFVLNDLHFDVHVETKDRSSKGYLNSKGVLAELSFS